MGQLRFQQQVNTSVSLNQRQVWDVASVVLAAALIVAAFASERQSTSGFLPGFEWRKGLELDTALSGRQGYLLNFEIEIELTQASLRHQEFGGEVYNPNGADIAFSRADGATPLQFSLLAYQGDRGVLKGILQVDTLYLSKPTPFFMYYGHKGEPLSALESSPVALHTLNITDLPPTHPSNTSQTLRHRLGEIYGQSPATFLTETRTESLREKQGVTYSRLEGHYLPTKKANLISWATSFEANCSQYFLERSADGAQFEVIARLNGHGFSLEEVSYRLIDPSPLLGANYYRIRQLNTDQSYSYSPVWVVNPLSISQHASTNS